MPDSQNKQGEHNDRCRHADLLVKANKQDLTPGEEAELRCLDQSLLAQQHAPSKEVGERIEELSLRCGEDLFDYLDFLPPGEFGNRFRLTDIVKKYLTELATELTKGWEEEKLFAANLLAYREDEITKLRQQLAEAKEQASKAECDLLPHYAAIKAGDKLVEELRTQNIALSAVVERTRTALEAARVHFEYCGYGDKWEREVAREGKLPEFISDALTLQPDLSLYGRIVEILRHVSNHVPVMPDAVEDRHIYNKANQLLADLGQSK